MNVKFLIPDDIAISISSHLIFRDLCNLEETSKGFQKALKNSIQYKLITSGWNIEPNIGSLFSEKQIFLNLLYRVDYQAFLSELIINKIPYCILYKNGYKENIPLPLYMGSLLNDNTKSGIYPFLISLPAWFGNYQ